nr:HAD-IA family hydrolase [Arsenicicoccus dermatophilus]
MVFDLGQVLVARDPLPAIAAGVGEERARAFLADGEVFATYHRDLDLGVPVEQAQQRAISAHPGYADEIRSYVTHVDRSLTHQIDGTVQLLRELYDARVPLFALTNWSAELFEAHARPRFPFLAGFLDIVVSGAEGVVKPDPAIFSVLEQRMGIPLTECCYTDDSPRNVLAGRACGLDAITFTTPERLRVDLGSRGAPVRPA